MHRSPGAHGAMTSQLPGHGLAHTCMQASIPSRLPMIRCRILKDISSIRPPAVCVPKSNPHDRLVRNLSAKEHSRFPPVSTSHLVMFMSTTIIANLQYHPYVTRAEYLCIMLLECKTGNHQKTSQALVLLKSWLLQQGRLVNAHEWTLPKAAMQKLQELR